MNPRARFALRSGLLAVPVALGAVFVLVARNASFAKSWWAWLPLGDWSVTLLSCGRQDSRTPVSYGSSVVDLFVLVPVVLLALALVGSVGLPWLARVLARVVAAMFVVQLGVFARAWLEKAVVGRSGLDQDPYCNDALQVSQAISRGAYLDTAVLAGLSLLLLMVLEVDQTLSGPPMSPRRRPARREIVVVRVLTVILLVAAAYAFVRAVASAGSPAVVLEVGGLMLLTTAVALPVGLASGPVVRSVAWASWFVGTGVALTS